MTETSAVNQEPEPHRSAKTPDANAVRRLAVDATRRVIARDGAGKVTLDSVALEAGLPQGGLLSHFNNEQDLLMTVAADDLAALAKSMRASADSQDASADTASPQMMERVQELEDAFATMIDKQQKSLNERNDIAAWVEQCVKDLQQRVDMSDRQGQLRAEIKSSLPPKPRADARAAPPPPRLVDPSPPPAPAARLVVEPPPMIDIPPAAARVTEIGSIPDELPPVLDPSNQEVPSNSQEAVLMDNYLLDARRATIAKQAGNERARHEAKRRSKRVGMLAGALGLIVVLGVGAIFLNRNVISASPVQPSAPQEIAAVEPASSAPLEDPAPPATPAPQVTAAAPAPAPAVPTPAAAPPPEAQPLEKLTELATAGDPKAERDLGLKYLAGDGVAANENEAARWLMRAAYRGEPTAGYWLGTLYARGQGVPADAFQANHWYEAAAKKGNRRAMHSLAVAYFQGWGVEKNYSEAARWFRSSADLGLTDSQFNLAVLYERGAGIPQSLTEAYKWYAIAAKGGDMEAQSRVAALATQLAPADLALAQQAAASFRPTPMDQNANLGAEISGG
jgi:localization factor PodJL